MSRNVRWGVPGNRADQPVKHSTLIVGRTATVNAAITPDTVIATTTIDGVTVTAIRTPKVATDRRADKRVPVARLRSRLIRRRAAAVNADVTPTTVVAQAFIDTPSVSGDANVTPTTVVAQAFIDTPAVTADANVTTTTVTAQAFVDTPTVQTIRVIHIATAIHRKGQVQKARLGSRLVRKARIGVVSADANVTAGDVAATAFIDTPSVSGDANVIPTTVTAQAFVDTPTVTGDANVTPTTVAAQAFVDTPTVSGDANVTTTTVIAQVFIDTPTVTASRTPRRVEAAGRAARNTRGPQLRIRSSILLGRTPVVSADANVTPDTVVATVFIDTPSVSAARPKVLVARDRKLKLAGPQLKIRSKVVQGIGPPALVNADVVAGDVAVTVAIPTPSVTAGRVLGQTIVPPQPLGRPREGRLRSRLTRRRVAVSASVTTTTVVAQASIDTPTVTGDANVTPDTVVAQAFVDTPGITASGDADVTAGAVPTEAFIPTPGVTGDANVTLTTVAAVASIPTPSVAGDADITPTTVVGQATIPTPTVTAAAAGDADVNLETVVAVVNMDALPLVEPGGLIRHRGLIGYGFSNSSPFGNRRP